MWRFLGVVGTVLFLFGLASYALTTEFDLWTAVHVTGGGILMAVAGALNFADLRRSLVSAGTRHRVGVLVATVLFAVIVVGLNVLAFRSPWRMDVTENRIHTLDPWSRDAVATLQSPVEILAFFRSADPGLEETEQLLERYRENGGPMLRWEWVDPETHPERAMKHDVRRSGTIVAVAGETTARVTLDPGAGIDETVVTPLILRVSDPTPRFVRFLEGFGGHPTHDLQDPRGLGALAGELEAENLRTAGLRIRDGEDVPADTAVVALVGPRLPLGDDEVARLERYLDGGGSLLVLLDPGVDAGLDRLLRTRGAVVGDDMIVDPENVPMRGARLGLDATIVDFADHAVTRAFRGPILLPGARSVDVVTGEGPSGVVLARTGAEAWAEGGWREMVETSRASRGEGDRPGPVPVAVAMDGSDAGAGRIVVVGDADLATNAGLYVGANREFVLRTIRWLAGLGDRIDLGPRRMRSSRIELSVTRYRTLFRLGVLLVPEAILIVGLGVWWWRRGL
jgi:hypothetical protein